MNQSTTVLDVNKDHPRETKNAVFVARRSFLRGKFLLGLAIWGLRNIYMYSLFWEVVFIRRKSFKQVWLYLTSDTVTFWAVLINGFNCKQRGSWSEWSNNRHLILLCSVCNIHQLTIHGCLFSKSWNKVTSTNRKISWWNPTLCFTLFLYVSRNRGDGNTRRWQFLICLYTAWLLVYFCRHELITSLLHLRPLWCTPAFLNWLSNSSKRIYGAFGSSILISALLIKESFLLIFTSF